VKKIIVTHAARLRLRYSHPGAGIVCDNSETLADRPHAPYNEGRMAGPRCPHSPAKPLVKLGETPARQPR